MPRVYLSLGSNLGDRLALLRAAVQQLQAHGLALMDASPLYESEAWEEEPGQTDVERRWYLNCALAVETTLRPRDLLDHLQAIETALGRTRTAGLTPEAQRFTPRTVDIDIIFYGEEVISVPDDIHVPHLLAAERAFVLRPLADIAPELTHPTLYRSIRDLLAELADEHEVRPGAYPARWFEEPA
jgi:2-amino-4-hydroxy-6-hydroxymethyldihydropteridine diphosphokinase